MGSVTPKTLQYKYDMDNKLQLLSVTRSPLDPYNHVYGRNSMGYRCPEFDSIIWEDSVLFFGCSHTFGIGIRDDDTITNQLQLILKMPVINLGQGGTGYTYQWINSTILKNHGVKPKAVVYLMPEHSRQTVFHIKNDYLTPRSMGHWNLCDKNVDRTEVGTALIADEIHATAMAYYYSKNLEILWDCPTLLYSWAAPLPTHSNIKLLESSIDSAPGESNHPGPITNKIRATIIAQDLKQWCR